MKLFQRRRKQQNTPNAGQPLQEPGEVLRPENSAAEPDVTLYRGQGKEAPREDLSDSTLVFSPIRERKEEMPEDDFWAMLSALKEELGTSEEDQQPPETVQAPQEKEQMLSGSLPEESEQERTVPKEDVLPEDPMGDLFSSQPEGTPETEPLRGKKSRRKSKHNPAPWPELEAETIPESQPATGPAPEPTPIASPGAEPASQDESVEKKHYPRRQSLEQRHVPPPVLPGVVRPGRQAPVPTLAEEPENPLPEEPEPPTVDVPEAAPEAQKKLKKKSREHKPTQTPEEAYRRYSQGFGLLQGCLIAAVLVAVAGGALSLYLGLGWSFLPETVSDGWLRITLLLLCLVQLALAFPLWREGLEELKRAKVPLELLLLLAAILSLVDGISALRAARAPLCGIPMLLITLDLWGRYDERYALLTVTKLLRGVEDAVGVHEVTGTEKGRKGLARGTGSTEHFMTHLNDSSWFDRYRRVYTPVMGGLVLFASVVITALTDASFSWIATLLFTAALSPALFLVDRRLFALLSKRLANSRAAVCGWYGAKVFGGRHAIFVTDNDLFPEKQIQLNGMKLYTGDVDRVIGYATAIAEATDSTLRNLFDELRENRNGRRFHVDRFRYYETGGVGAEIQGDVVLMGPQSFMKRMGVHMEGSIKVKQAMYVSVNGVLAAVFAIRYKPTESVRRGLAAAAGNRHFRLILVTRECLLTPEFISEIYGVPTANMVYPGIKERLRLSEQEFREGGEQGALLTEDAFGAFAEAAAGGRALQSAGRLGLIFSLLQVLVTLLLMGLLAWLGAVETANAGNYLLYLLGWLLPTWLLSGWTRRY